MPMTATAICVGDRYFITSVEFSPLMHLNPGFDGEYLLNLLKSVNSESDFINIIEDFDNFCFGARSLLFYKTKRRRFINFANKNYSNDWGSTDFLFFLNTSNRSISFIDRDRKFLKLLPGELMVFYLGSFHLLLITHQSYESGLECLATA